jgi:hypothetical protein
MSAGSVLLPVLLLKQEATACFSVTEIRRISAFAFPFLDKSRRIHVTHNFSSAWSLHSDATSFQSRCFTSIMVAL